MILRGSTPIPKIYKGSIPIAKVYKGSTLVWTAETGFGNSQGGNITFTDADFWGSYPGEAGTNYIKRNGGSFVEFKTTATQFQVKIGGSHTIDSTVEMTVNGVFAQHIGPVTVINTEQLYTTIVLPAGEKIIRLLNGAQNLNTGQYFMGVVMAGADTLRVRTPIIPAIKWQFDGDSITAGFDSIIPVLNGFAFLFRRDYGFEPFIANDAVGSRQMDTDTTLLADAKAARLSAQLNATGANHLFMALGTNNWHLGAHSKAQFKLRYKNWLTAQQALRPDVIIWCISPIFRSEGLAATNSAGATLADYANAIQESVNEVQTASGSTNLRYIYGWTLIDGAGDLSDGLHPTIIGHEKYHDNLFLQIQTNGGTTADITAPYLISATVSDDNKSKVILEFSEALDAGYVSPIANYAISGKTITSRTQTGKFVEVITSVGFAFGDTATVSYAKTTSPFIRDAAGNEVAAFSGFAITNNVTATTPQYVAMTDTPAAHMRVYGNGFLKSNGIKTNPSTDNELYELAGQMGNGDWIEFKNVKNYTTGQRGIYLTKTPNASNGAGTLANYAFRIMLGSNNMYEKNTVALEAEVLNAIYRIHYDQGVILLKKSTDNGVTFTLIKQVITGPVGTYYVCLQLSEGTRMADIRSTFATVGGAAAAQNDLRVWNYPAISASIAYFSGVGGGSSIATIQVDPTDSISKIYLKSTATNQAYRRVNPTSFVVKPEVIKITVKGVRIIAGQLFVKLASLGQVGNSHQLVDGDNEWTIVTSGVTDISYFWICTSSTLATGGEGYIRGIEVENVP